MKILNDIRYNIIELIARDMPVVLNVNIARPSGYQGKLIDIPRADLPGMFSGLVFPGADERPAIISPTRDIKEPEDQE